MADLSDKRILVLGGARGIGRVLCEQLLADGANVYVLDRDAGALDWARAEGVAVLPLGEGSNIVFAGDVDALVLQVASGGIEAIADDGDSVTLRVQAGEDWHQLVQWTLQQGLYGLENLALIPGTVGAAPIQNIGAYGVECEQFIRAVYTCDIASGERTRLSAAECDFAYRDSNFKGPWRDRLVITAVELELSRQPKVNITYPALAAELEELAQPGPREVFDAVVAIRRRRLPDPAREPNAGSFFKNPIVDAELARRLVEQHPELPIYPQADGRSKLPAAWLIDACGWKGQRRDGVGVHPQHALVLVNYGSDSGAELLALAGGIAAAVKERFGIDLEIEPRVYGGE